ncbi:MAG TPA: methyl-accepting chemotaxis protein [Cellulomonas sp.]
MSLIAPSRRARPVGRRGHVPLLGSVETLRAVLDSVEANVFVADLDLVLVYANRRAMATAATIEPALRESFGTGVADLLFGSIHRFHRDPARVERILRDPRSFPHRATFAFGPVSLATNIAAVTGADGVIVGYCVAWDDISDRRVLRETTQRVADELGEASAGLSAVTTALGEQARSTALQAQTAAAATEQMSASVQEIATNASNAATLAGQAVTAVGDATDQLTALGTSSQEIGGVVRLITSIAEQTNLLALNATIEAARAGEAGKGFAVVAGEVKELARETAAATQRVTELIATLQSDSGRASHAVAGITELIQRISDAQTSIAGAVEQQSATTNEISRSVAEVARTADLTLEGAASVGEGAEHVVTTSEQMREMVHED